MTQALLARARGTSRAVVAIEHTFLATVWTMLTNGTLYDEPGPDYYARRNPERTKHHAIRQFEALGYAVTVEPWGAA